MIEYHRLTPQDRLPCLPAMLELIDMERRCPDSLIYFGPLATNERFLGRFFAPAGATWGAFEGQKLRGFALMGFSPIVRELWLPYIVALGAEQRDCGVLFGSFVQGSYRGRGLGSALHRCRANQAREQGVKYLFSLVHPDNTSSMRLLEKHGFSAVDHLDSYKQSGPRAVMYCSLESSSQVSRPSVLGENAAARLSEGGVEHARKQS